MMQETLEMIKRDLNFLPLKTNANIHGESASALWQPLFKKGLEIQFAHRTFVWANEAQNQAVVHCVIIGFSMKSSISTKVLYDGGISKKVEHINGYLLDAPDVFIQSHGKPLTAGMPEMSKGSQPTDGGNLILSEEERQELIAKYPSINHLMPLNYARRTRTMTAL